MHLMYLLRLEFQEYLGRSWISYLPSRRAEHAMQTDSTVIRRRAPRVTVLPKTFAANSPNLVLELQSLSNTSSSFS